MSTTTFFDTSRTQRVLRDAASGEILATDTKRRHTQYLTIDPRDIGQKLVNCGFKIERKPMRSKLRELVRVWPGTAIPGSYVAGWSDMGALLFDHTGSRSIQGQAKATRNVCENVFHAPTFRIHHCSDEAREFQDYPERFVAELFTSARSTRNRLEYCKLIPTGGLIVDALAAGIRNRHDPEHPAFKPIWKERKLKNILDRLTSDFATYARNHGHTVWSAFQAITEQSTPVLDRFVGRCLTPTADGGEWNTINDRSVPPIVLN